MDQAQHMTVTDRFEPKHGVALKCRLLASDNKYLTYPCDGIIHILEMRTTLVPNVAVFHRFENGTLSAPVVVKSPRFEVSA